MNSIIFRTIQEIFIFKQSIDLNLKYFPFIVYHGATPWSHWAKQTLKKLNFLGKTAVDKSAWIKAWGDIVENVLPKAGGSKER